MMHPKRVSFSLPLDGSDQDRDQDSEQDRDREDHVAHPHRLGPSSSSDTISSVGNGETENSPGSSAGYVGGGVESLLFDIVEEDDDEDAIAPSVQVHLPSITWPTCATLYSFCVSIISFIVFSSLSSLYRYIDIDIDIWIYRYRYMDI